MDLFLPLFFKLLPLLIIIAAGFAAGRFLRVEKESIALLLLYILTPVIVFHGAYTTTLGVGIIVLPLFFFLSACLFSFVASLAGKALWKDNTKNIFAYTAGTGNTGYFGIPVALALLGPGVLGQVVLATIGLIFYESSVGFYVTARGNYSIRQSVMKVIGLPSLYALLIGLALNGADIGLPEGYTAVADSFRGAYTVLGTMMVGLGIGSEKLKIDGKFLAACFFAKFLLWPLYAFAFVTLDRTTLHLLTEEARTILLLLSVMPMAANTVVVATALNVQPGKAALGVLLTTLFALVYIPLMLTIIGS